MHETQVRTIAESHNAGFGQIIRKEVPKPKLVFSPVVRSHPCQAGMATQPVNRYHAIKALCQHSEHVVSELSWKNYSISGVSGSPRISIRFFGHRALMSDADSLEDLSPNFDSFEHISTV